MSELSVVMFDSRDTFDDVDEDEQLPLTMPQGQMSRRRRLTSR